MLDEEERRCPDCGATVDAEDEFCPSCGYPLRADAADETRVHGSGERTDDELRLPGESGAESDLGERPDDEDLIAELPDVPAEPRARPLVEELVWDAAADDANQELTLAHIPDEEPAEEGEAEQDEEAGAAQAEETPLPDTTLLRVAGIGRAEEQAAPDEEGAAEDEVENEAGHADDAEAAPPVIVLDPDAYAVRQAALEAVPQPYPEGPQEPDPTEDEPEREEAVAEDVIDLRYEPLDVDELEATQPHLVERFRPSQQVPAPAPWESPYPPAPEVPEPGYIAPPARRMWVAPAPPIYTPDYGVPPAVAFFQQRVQAYQQAGYQLLSRSSYEAVLARGKVLGVGRWLLALVTIVGAVWYFLLLLLSGFRADKVYITLESDGRVYEEGAGAAHVRRQRARTGRRWTAFGGFVFVIALLLTLILGAVAGVVLTQERYQAALREAYPAVTLFEERFSDAQANADDVDLARNGAVAFGVLGVIALVGLWGGATLLVIGTIHAGAYQVLVRPLPGQA